MNYFQLGVRAPRDEDDEEIGLCQFQVCATSEDVVNLPWYDGVVLASVPTPIDLSLDDLGGWAAAFPDYWSSPVPVASRALREAVESASVDNIQWFPVRLIGGRVAEAPDYFAFNVVGAVAAADRSRSVRVRLLETEGADIFKELVLSAEALRSLHFFRLAESLSTIIVSERVRSAAHAAGIRTLSFTPLSVA